MAINSISMIWSTRLAVSCAGFAGILTQQARATFFDLLESKWQFYAVDQTRGRCYYQQKIITIPVWAMKKDKAYLEWYVCHEMSHAVAGPAAKHGPEFQRVLASICSPNAIRYELTYKAREVVRAGIQLTCLLDD